MFLADVKNGSPVVVGVKQSQKAIARGQAVGALIALDADEHVTGPIKALCEAAGVRLETVSTMQELGKACGIHVGASVARCTQNPVESSALQKVFIIIKSYTRERRCRNAYNQPIGS